MKVIIATLAVLLMAAPAMAIHEPETDSNAEHAEAFAEFMSGSTNPNDIEDFAVHTLEAVQELGPVAGCEEVFPMIVAYWTILRNMVREWEGYVDADGVAVVATSPRAAALVGTAARQLNLYITELQQECFT